MVSAPSAPRGLLVLDAGSPAASAALACGGELRAVRETAAGEERSSSDQLLALVAAVLEEAAQSPRELLGAVALAGPGSFTGLRIAFATVLGLHQALGLPATSFSTFDALALQAPAGGGRPLLALVDALRGEWHAQPYSDPTALARIGEPLLLDAEALGRWAPASAVGFGCRSIAAGGGVALDCREPVALAAAVAVHLSRRPPAWEVGRLVEPTYLRPPTPVARKP